MAGRGCRAEAYEQISSSDVNTSLTAIVYRLSATRLCQTNADGDRNYRQQFDHLTSLPNASKGFSKVGV